MHRSGTSALARVVNLLGADLGKHLMAAADDNKKGFFEHEPIVAIHEQLLTELGLHWSDSTSLPEGWLKTDAATKAQTALEAIIDDEFADSPLWALKDPRQCRLMPLWLPILKKRNIQPHFIIAYRHPIEVAASLASRDAMAQEAALECWLSYTVEALLSALDHPYSVISYDELMQDWQPALKRVGKELALDWPIASDDAAKEIHSFLSPKLRNHKATLEALPKPIAACLKQLQKPTRKSLEKIQQTSIEQSLAYAASLRQARLETFMLKKSLDESLKTAAAAEHRAEDIQGQFSSQQESLSAVAAELQKLRDSSEKKEQQHKKAEALLKEQLNTLYESTSWKMTQPLRTLKKLAKQGSND